MRVLVTGGTGFIGSHQVVALLEAGHSVSVIDDLSNSSPVCLDRVAELCRDELDGGPVPLHQVDLLDRAALDRAIEIAEPEAVIHFAARKHVHQSVQVPVEYYLVNLGGLLNLVDALDATDVRRLVYSSSGSIYGDAETHPIEETAPIRPTNPYSRTKAQGEQILADLCRADPSWAVTALRYFNPAGAHPSGRIGEDPTGLRTNLLPVLMDVAFEATEGLVVHGDDYPTPDGTAVRDYVHVMDVVQAHVTALHQPAGFRACNIGRGVGVSVLELVATVASVTGRHLPYEIRDRRPGDVAALYGDTRLAAELLGLCDWRSLEEICADAWRWRTANPDGYGAGDNHRQ